MRVTDFSHLNESALPLLSLTDHWLLAEKAGKKRVLMDGICGMGILTNMGGAMEVRINESNYLVDQNAFLVVNRGSRLKIEAGEGSIPILLLFKEKTANLAAAELFHEKLLDESSAADLKDHQLIEHIHYANASLTERMTLLIKSGNSCASFQQLKSDGIVRSLIEDLCHMNYEALQCSANLSVKKEITRSDLFVRLNMVRDWMAQSFKNSIDIEEAAAMAMMSKAHFSRHFKTVYGITPYQYLMNIRLSWAEDQIMNSDDSMQQIAEAICFETLSSFSYQFKNWKGLSPRQLRKQKLSQINT